MATNKEKNESKKKQFHLTNEVKEKSTNYFTVRNFAQSKVK